jgi:protein ImuB
VLFASDGNRGPRVAAWGRREAQQANSPALQIGMPLAEADAMFAERGSSTAHIEAHDPAADLAGLRELARTCNDFSPLVGIEESASPECLLLDVTGCEHLFGGEQNLVDALAEQLRQRGFQVRAALAPTIGAAWAAARCLAKPHHQPVLSDTGLDDALAPLPITALRLPTTIIETLHELGLRRIGQVRALPRETLPSRFGPELLRRLDQAFGDVPELLAPEHSPEPIAAVWVTDEPLTDRETLKFVTGQLLDELLGRLKPRREGVRQLFCQIKGTAARPVELPVNLVGPSDVVKHLLELLSQQIDRADLPEGISFVRLEATNVASVATRQRDLFGFETDTDTHREVSSLLDRLSNRLGATAVVHAVLVPEAQPELSVRHEPVVLAERQGTRARGSRLPQSAALDSQPSAQTRPLRLFTPPEPIEATAAGPEGAPMHFRWERREHRVIKSWGPERIETGWWRERSVCRDYFRVVTQTGQHFWIFRCFDQAAWFIHGAFD